MKSSDDLFQLIKSLTKSEKRYFKIVSSLHTIGDQNKYLVLFDEIEKQKVYDEDSIKKKFVREKFVKQLPVAKNYLYKLILNSTDQHFSIDSKLRAYLNQIDFLFNKLLYKQCERLIQKAKKVAEKYEKHTILMDIFVQERRLMRRLYDTTKNYSGIKPVFKNELAVIKKYRNIIDISHLTDDLNVLIASEGPGSRTKSEIKKFKNVIKNDLFSSENKMLSYRAQNLHYIGKAVYYYKLEDYVNALSSVKKVVELLETNPQFIEENPADYQHSLVNLIGQSIYLEQYSEAYPVIEKLKKIELKSKLLQHERFYFINSVLMTIVIKTGRFKEGIELINRVQKAIEEKDLKAPRIETEMTLFYNIASIYIGAGNYSKAIIYLNKIINTPSDIRNDIYCYAKILSLIAHYEMGNEDLQEYEFKSTYRYLNQRNRLYKFETIVLEFIRKRLPKIDSPNDLILALKKLKMEIVKITKNPYEKKALEFFDFISWLDSKIENRSFADIVKQKAAIKKEG